MERKMVQEYRSVLLGGTLQHFINNLQKIQEEMIAEGHEELWLYTKAFGKDSNTVRSMLKKSDCMVAGIVDIGLVIGGWRPENDKEYAERMSKISQKKEETDRAYENYWRLKTELDYMSKCE